MEQPDAEPARASARSRLRRWLPRISTGATFGLAGLLIATSSLASGGIDLRAERQTDLSDLVRTQVQRKQALEQEAVGLRAEIDELSKGVDGTQSGQAQQRVEKLGKQVGMTPVEGPGLTVTLDDAPPEMRKKSDDLDALVVHQQDIQAVANALWAGGAEAMTIQGQRIIATSAIRCVGNSVVLQGVPYPPPYRVTAVGDVDKMRRALDAAPGVQAYLQDVQRLQLYYDIERSTQVSLPGFEGSVDLGYAREARTDPEKSGN